MQKNIASLPKYRLSILTTESILFQGEVISAIFPEEAGTFEVLANHAPMISLVTEGEIKITNIDGSKTTVKITGGFLEVYENESTLLCYSKIDSKNSILKGEKTYE